MVCPMRDQGNANEKQQETDVHAHLTTILKLINTKCWQPCIATVTVTHGWWQVYGTTTLEDIWRV